MGLAELFGGMGPSAVDEISGGMAEDLRARSTAGQLAGARRAPFSPPDLSEDQLDEARNQGIWAGLASLQKGPFNAIFTGMATAKAERERQVFDTYLERRMQDPNYGSDESDRLMAMRYGGTGYVGRSSLNKPSVYYKPIGHGQVQRQLAYPGEAPEDWQNYGEPYSQYKPTMPTAKMGVNASQIRAARRWWSSLSPDEQEFRRRPENTILLPADEQYMLKLLPQRAADETESEYSSWFNAHFLAKPSEGPGTPPADEGPSWIDQGRGWVRSVWDEMTSPDAATATDQSPLDEGDLDELERRIDQEYRGR